MSPARREPLRFELDGIDSFAQRIFLRAFGVALNLNHGIETLLHERPRLAYLTGADILYNIHRENTGSRRWHPLLPYPAAKIDFAVAKHAPQGCRPGFVRMATRIEGAVRWAAAVTYRNIPVVREREVPEGLRFPEPMADDNAVREGIRKYRADQQPY